MLDGFPVSILIGTALGFLSGLGIGGGSLLILWLTLVIGMEQNAAQCLNLLFFLPSALIACRFRWKRGTLNRNVILPAAIAGCIAATMFSLLTIDTGLLKTLFGILLIFTGLRELTYKQKETSSS